MPTVQGELMANGAVFENGFATTPLCCPGCMSILSIAEWAQATVPDHANVDAISMAQRDPAGTLPTEEGVRLDDSRILFNRLYSK